MLELIYPETQEKGRTMYYAVIIELVAYKNEKLSEERTYSYLVNATDREQLEQKTFEYLDEAKDSFNMILELNAGRRRYYIKTKRYDVVPAEEYYSLDSLFKKIPMKEFTKIWKRCLAVTE